MTNQDWIEMLKVFPPEEHNTLVIVLQNGCEVNVDCLFRFEPNFLVMRGRVGGQVEEGRGFFIPYNQMLYFRIERLTNIAELKDIMDGSGFRKNAPDSEAHPAENQGPVPVEPVPALPPVPTAPAITDATASRNALLDRIRAARATQMAPRRGHHTQ